METGWQLLCTAIAIVKLSMCFGEEDDQTMQSPSIYSQSSPCGFYSSIEQQFASQLNETNQSLFCNRFSQAQRNAAMQMAGQTNAIGNVMTQDQAVEKVAQDNKMIPATQQQGNQSCPLK